jgi:IS30 family transposase
MVRERMQTLSIDQIAEVRRLSTQGYSTGQIKRDLGLDVTLRTIQRVIRENRPHDPFGLFALAEALHDIADAMRAQHATNGRH